MADHVELVTALRRDPWPAASLQLIGDGLLAAVRAAADGSADLAHACVTGLRERRWAGDGELAEALEGVLGSGPTPMLRPVPVDLEELSMILEGDPVQEGGRIAYTNNLDALHRALRGLARVVSNGTNIAYLKDIVVHPDEQRGGLGRRLVTEALRPFESIRQKVLLTGDEPGQRAFYESLGFTEIRDLDDGSLRAFVQFS